MDTKCEAENLIGTWWEQAGAAIWHTGNRRERPSPGAATNDDDVLERRGGRVVAVLSLFFGTLLASYTTGKNSFI